MTNEPEATSVSGKANSLIRQIICVPQEPATPVKMKPDDWERFLSGWDEKNGPIL